MTSKHSATFLNLIKPNKTTSITKYTSLDMKHTKMNKTQPTLHEATPGKMHTSQKVSTKHLQ